MPSKKDKMTATTAMQEAFIGFLLADPKQNGTDAALKAGCSPKNAAHQACMWLKDPKIIARVEEFKARREKRTGVDADYIVTAAKELVERCMQRKPVMEFDPELGFKVQVMEPTKCSKEGCDGGMPVGVWEFDSAGAVGGLKLLANHVRGFNAPKEIEASGKGGSPLVPQALPLVDMERLKKVSDALLDRLIAETDEKK